ncbi:putative indole-3-pyruvate monooxygenase YUCCA3, partial [Neolecta irregularis DAH-3]
MDVNSAQNPPPLLDLVLDTSSPKEPIAHSSKYDSKVVSLAKTFIGDFSIALEKCNIARVMELIHPHGWWRDKLALSWEFRTVHDHYNIEQFLTTYLRKAQFYSMEIEHGKTPLLVDGKGRFTWIQVFFKFETEKARGRGIIRLQQEGMDWKAFTIFTNMSELKGYEEKIGLYRSCGAIDGEHLGRKSWAEQRREALEKADPEVLIVGGGQAGLCIAARLSMLGVDALVVEKENRIGDNWRKRYESLVLHDPVWFHHLPYNPFPESWPIFPAKDQLADWLESYVKSLELNAWTGTTIERSTFDEQAKRWTVEVNRKDGANRTLNPAHIVLATGVSGEPNIPVFKGMDNFKGKVHHSSAHTTGKSWSGRKAIVIGSGNSGHDIAQDFYEHGADVTMVQRSSTYVCSKKNAVKLFFQGLYEEGGPLTKDADLIFASMPNPVVAMLQQIKAKELADLDREILD